MIPLCLSIPPLLSQYKNLQSNVQLSIVRLLADLGGDNIHIIKDVDLTKESMAWDTSKRIKFEVPFRDVKPLIYLGICLSAVFNLCYAYSQLIKYIDSQQKTSDDMLPRIVELAENSSNRQMKVAACELLHSIILSR